MILTTVGALGVALDLILFAPRRRRAVAVNVYPNGQQVVRERRYH